TKVIILSRFIDIHTHNLAPHSADLTQILAVMVTSCATIPVADYFSAAIHPYSLSGFDITWLDELAHVVRQKNCIAIGETGLDWRSEYQTTQKQQHAIFDEHIFLANKLHLPLIIHSVKATRPVLAHLAHKQTPFVFHGYTGSLASANEIIDSGGMLSFGAKIIQDNQLQERVREIDNSKILLETDESNTAIQDIYAALAAIKSMTIEELKIQIEINFSNLFTQNL
ncbi:MAG: TatD family hydrolase, partial [Mucinivorans sp.]